MKRGLMQNRKITKVEVSDLFWKDLAGLRKTPNYWAIRKGIAEMIQAVSRGDPGGDKAFIGDKKGWAGILHKHLPGKIILFTMYPEESTIRLCALKKHDFYGFRNERKSRVEDAIRKVRGAAERPAKRSPEWTSLKWQDPGQIAGNPELVELSRDGLDALYQSILEEQDTFEILARRLERENMSMRLQESFTQSWMDALIEAQGAIEGELVARARRRAPHLEAAAFADWGRGPG